MKRIFTTPKKTCKTVYTLPEPDYEDEEEEDDYEGLYTDLLNDYNALGSRFESETRLSSQYQKRVSELSNELTDKKMENMRLTDRINHLQDRCDYFEKQVNELREEETKRLKKQHDETFSFYDTPDTETEKDEFEDDFLNLLDLRG